MIIDMQKEPYQERDGYRIVPNEDEREQLWNLATGETKAMVGLGAYASMRINEAANTKLEYFQHRDKAGWYVVVPEESAKRDKWRTCPVPEKVKIQCEAYAEGDGPIWSRTTRTLSRHIESLGEEMADQTGNPVWKHLTFHDLRRAWTHAMLNHCNQKLLVMQWGGWDDWRTFRDSYLTRFSEEKEAEVRDDIPWL